jgi:hypothetical protein
MYPNVFFLPDDEDFEKIFINHCNFYKHNNFIKQH